MRRTLERPILPALPGIDGYEVARRFRAAPGGDQLYLVALTGRRVR